MSYVHLTKLTSSRAEEKEVSRKLSFFPIGDWNANKEEKDLQLLSLLINIFSLAEVVLDLEYF